MKPSARQANKQSFAIRTKGSGVLSSKTLVGLKKALSDSFLGKISLHEIKVLNYAHSYLIKEENNETNRLL